MSFIDWQLGCSTSLFGGYQPNLFAQYAKHGISAAEISASYNFLFHEFDIVNNYAIITSDAQANNIAIRSLHLPFWRELDISQRQEGIAQKTVQTHMILLDVLEKMHIKTAVIHPSYAPITPDERPARIEEATKNLAILAEFANERGITLAVENMSSTALGNSADELIGIVTSNPLLCICFDANHLVRQSNVEFIKKAAQLIRTVHISDYHLENELHLMPFEGKNDWIGIIAALQEVGYNGPFMFELAAKYNYTLADINTCHRKINALLTV